MHIIVCLDERNGISFGGKRLSRDRIQLEKMLELVSDAKLYVSSYTANLFENTHPNLVVCDDYLFEAGENDYCFAENGDFMNCSHLINDIILYRWNRKYPYDEQLDNRLLDERHCISSKDFEGSSHTKITEEIMKK